MKGREKKDNAENINSTVVAEEKKAHKAHIEISIRVG